MRDRLGQMQKPRNTGRSELYTSAGLNVYRIHMQSRVRGDRTRVNKHGQGCVELCNIQREQGLYFYIENLRKARSWMSHDMMALLSFDDVHSFNGDYCRYAESGSDIGVDGQ